MPLKINNNNKNIVQSLQKTTIMIIINIYSFVCKMGIVLRCKLACEPCDLLLFGSVKIWTVIDRHKAITKPHVKSKNMNQLKAVRWISRSNGET